MSRKASKVFQQSGVIPDRVSDGKIEVLLITNRRQQHWAIPKGGISKAMTPPDSAAKEAWEEAGVIGQVDSNQLGTYKQVSQTGQNLPGQGVFIASRDGIGRLARSKLKKAAVAKCSQSRQAG